MIEQTDSFGMSTIRYQRKMTTDEQLEALAELVPQLFIKKSQYVRGPYTTSDYVTWKLNQIFTPVGWSFLITEGPDVIDLSGTTGYVRTKGRLEVVFANGSISAKDEIGVTPIYGTNDNDGERYDLRDTSPEVHETAMKASVSDCLKACAERFGLCFRPLIDQDLEHSIRAVQQRVRAKKDGRPPTTTEGLIEELYDVEPEERPFNPTPPNWAEWPENQWTAFYEKAVLRLKFKHNNHAQNALKKALDGKAPESYQVAWVALVEHQKAKKKTGAEGDAP